MVGWLVIGCLVDYLLACVLACMFVDLVLNLLILLTLEWLATLTFVNEQYQ